jgi:hypothetical protein
MFVDAWPLFDLGKFKSLATGFSCRERPVAAAFGAKLFFGLRDR